MKSVKLGYVEITRIEELQTTNPPPSDMLAGFDEDQYLAHIDMIPQANWNADRSATVMSHQAWLLRSAGRNILVDTAIGNDKPRRTSVFDHLKTDFLSDLSAVGVEVQDVDMVLSTHLHHDHVGWHTRLVGGEWVPTFPNAEYVMPRADVEFFNPANDGRFTRRSDRFMVGVFDDSVRPVLEAGLATLWEETYVVDENLRLEAAPGHTPGASVIKLSSEGERAIFIGDMMHSPVQIARPTWNSCVCENQALSVRSRQRILKEAADNHMVIFAAHFGGNSGAEISGDGDSFQIKRWRTWT
jgi:glyoxylase-like metal-dependent hydrolase (beta-lactamase superfamily II)